MPAKAAALFLSASLLLSPLAHALTKRSATQEAKAFVGNMAKGDFMSPQSEFTRAMQKAANPRKLASIWASRTGSLGKFQGLGQTKAIRYHNYEITFVKAKFKTSAIWVKVVINSAGRIAGLFFMPVSTAH